MKGLEIFDYMYYRVARFYHEHDEKDDLSSTGSTIVSLSQYLIILDIIGLFLLEFFNQKERSEILDSYFIFFLVFILVLANLNDSKYKGKYTSYHEKWKDEVEKSKTIKDTIIILLIVLPFIFIPILMNVKDYTI